MQNQKQNFKTMKFGVVIFPGSNCDHDMVYLLRDLLKQEVVELWHKDTDLQNCDMIILPGGFSYGDYLRSGAIASLSPIMESVKAFANLMEVDRSTIRRWENYENTISIENYLRYKKIRDSHSIRV